MNQRLRDQRHLFLLFLGAVFVSLMTALPLVTASVAMQRYAQATQPVYSPTQLTFEQLDRNHDGYVDRKEAAAQPGLALVFERADRRPDGVLDKVEYAQALALLDGLNRRSANRP